MVTPPARRYSDAIWPRVSRGRRTLRIDRMTNPILPAGDALRAVIAARIAGHLNVDAGRLQAGEPFAGVIPDFDSLILLEIVLMLEGEFGLRLDEVPTGQVGAASSPANIEELAAQIEAAARHLKYVPAEPL
ncbi:acyl carrier protein [Burkholderia plantarii]|uniref:acyl carrier protein n=1 Tax=Burkholderia plantarii TaxID=41899 RepID=UPI0018DE2320|nr:acyl carrier protein [Burkholderia plantarii]MBI0325536.1 acyl carrier protein [Burkholderia plantarii]